MTSHSDQYNGGPSSSSGTRIVSSSVGGPAAATLIGAWSRRTAHDTDAAKDTTQLQDRTTQAQTTQLPSWFNDKEVKALKKRFKDLRGDLTESRTFVANNPVCDNCRRSGKNCVVHRQIACASCNEKHVACPRLRAFYRHVLAGYRGMTEDEVERALIFLKIIKTRKVTRPSANADPPQQVATPVEAAPEIEYIIIDSDDDDDGDDEEGQTEAQGVVRSMSRVSINSPGEFKVKTEDGASELEGEVARLERLLTRAKRKEAEYNRDRIVQEREAEEKQAAITNLEEQLTLERQESERLRLHLRNSIADGQKTINQLARHCSELRLIEEDVTRDAHNFDASGLSEVIKSLQRIVDKAITKDKTGIANIYRFETPVAVSENSLKRVREHDVAEDEGDPEATSEQEIWVRRAGPPKAKSGRTATKLPNADRGEGPSSLKRVRMDQNRTTNSTMGRK